MFYDSFNYSFLSSVQLLYLPPFQLFWCEFFETGVTTQVFFINLDADAFIYLFIFFKVQFYSNLGSNFTLLTKKKQSKTYIWS